MKQYFVYILANTTDKLYIWATNDLSRRVYEHREKLIDWFTKKYNITKLVYYESFYDINEALKREKQMKKWIRQYKLNVITDFNPNWRDLYQDIAQ